MTSSSSGELAETSSGWALADRIVQACVEHQLLGEAVHPVALGRYRVERPLGAGGMGQLLLARDPDLDRRVALKLIHPAQSRSPEARQRIVAEARAMARLSDPNVAQVYEVGEVGGQLFVAIEYIEGHDLRAWLDEGPHPWREVLAKFRPAGSGLAAAHDKGITHRDFKPDNVMLQTNGRVRVVDFGLALGIKTPIGESMLPGESREQLGPGGLLQLTRTGAVVGTPAYMAPEQWAGSTVDARTDQFAFCVALFEALVGARPFSGKTAAALQRAQTEGTLTQWPTTVPRWIRQIVLRGLQIEPEQRWPNMRALLTALDPSRRRRRWTIAGVGLLAVVSASLGLAVPAQDRCADAGASVAEWWHEARAVEVTAALTQADPGWGPASAVALVGQLEAHAEAWSVAARGVCAAQQSSEPSDPVAAQGCLARSRQQWSETVAQALEADPALLVSAVARAELLTDPLGCLDTKMPSVPDSPDALRYIATIERSLGAMSVRAGADGYLSAMQQGRAAAQAVIPVAGQDPALLARAEWTIGRLELADGQPRVAELHFRRGLRAARSSDDAPLAAAITVELVYAIATDRERFAEAQDLADEAAGMLAALGDPPLLGSRLDSHRASAIAHSVQGEHAQAVTLHERALRATRDTLGAAHPQTIAVLGNLGAALNYAGRAEEAELRLREALTVAQQSWGADHPRTATLLGTLGLSRMRQGDLEQATIDLRKSLEIRERSLGSAHAHVNDARYNLASALRRQQRHAEALTLLELGLTQVQTRAEARQGPWWVATGESSLAVGNLDRAREALGAALRVFERTGASPGDYARVRLGLARAWRDADPERARVLGEEARVDAVEAGSEKREAEADAFLAGE